MKPKQTSQSAKSKPRALESAPNPKLQVERVQLGVRMEKRMVKVLKAMAEYGDLSLGELLEDIVLHSFEGGNAQTFGPEDLKVIQHLKKVYGMDYDTHANARIVEKAPQT